MDEETPIVLVAPVPIVLKYDITRAVNGRTNSAEGALLWRHDGTNYEARLERSDFLTGSRTLTSTGRLTANGLEPMRFEDITVSTSVAQIDREAGIVHFSPDSPDVALTFGAQDELSVIIQLAAVFAGNTSRLPVGTTIAFQTIGSRSASRYAFIVGDSELLTLPGGTVNAIHLELQSVEGHDGKMDLWLAPEQGYLPVRMLVSQNSGNYIDHQWRSTAAP